MIKSMPAHDGPASPGAQQPQQHHEDGDDVPKYDYMSFMQRLIGASANGSGR